MSRLLARGIADFRLQFRNGFYYAAIAVAAMLVALLSSLPQWQLAWLMPLVLIGNVLVNGFYFMAATVLLEKAEHSLDAQAVTPLRAWEYLAGKIGSLCIVSLVESLVIVVLVRAAPVNSAALVLGIVTATGALACFGFLLVARYESINEFLFPSFVVTTLLTLPLLDLLGVWAGVLWYLHPLHGPIVLIGAAFEARPAAELGAALAAALGWMSAAFGACVHGFHRFVVEGAARA